MRHLIVGWRRGGISYAYQCLKNCGLEVGTTFQGTQSLEDAKERLSGSKDWEFSSDIVPFLNDLDLPKNLDVTLLLRDPMRVLNSMYFLGVLHNEKNRYLQNLLFDCAKQVNQEATQFTGKPCQFICFYLGIWLDLYQQANLKNKRYLKVESYPAQLLKHFKLNSDTNNFQKTLSVRNNLNFSGTNYSITFKELPKHYVEIMKRLCRDTGYYEPLWYPRGGHAHYLSPEWHH